MNIPELLKTKLLIPPVRQDLVERPQLFAQLDESLSRRLALVSAPAGYGKTTLVSAWARRLDLPVVWLSLDEADNDPARFLGHFCASFEAVDPPLAGSLLELAQADWFGGLGAAISIDAFQTGLLNRLQSISSPLVLILDDFHLISAQPIHRLVAFLVDHLPPRVHLVIASRSDPPLPLARLRARDHMVEIRQNDLRFTPGEAIAFLNQVMGLGLEAGDVTALASRTEGWIAGLRLAATSIQSHADVHRFIQDFKGSNRYILDYLVEEVLQRQPQTVRAFLLETSILDRLTGPLCDAVIGGQGAGVGGRGDAGTRGRGDAERLPLRRGEAWTGQRADPRGEGRVAPGPRPPTPGPQSQAMLEKLERANLFIVPLDDERKWYRYHRLFADLLQKQLGETHPELAPVLHRRASAWYEQNGLPAEAIDHALAAEDFERAAQLIERVAEATLMRSEATTLLKWFDALPEAQLHARPSLCAYHAWVLLLDGSPLNVVEARLQRVAEHQALLALPLQSWMAQYRGDLAGSVEQSRRALEQLPENEVFLRGLAALSLAGAYHINGDVAASQRVLQEAALSSHRTGNVMIAVYAAWYQAERCRREGDLQRARSLFRQALDLATDGNGDRLPIASQVLMGLGEIAREWNELDTAAHYVLEGIALGGRWAQAGALESYLTLARIRQAQGDWDGVHDALQAMRQVATEFKASDVGERAADMAEAWMQIMQGGPAVRSGQALEGPRRWAERYGLSGDVDPLALEKDYDVTVRRLHKYEYPIAARLRMAEGRPAEALALLESALPILETMNRVDLVIENQVLTALAARALGQDRRAMQSLERALALGEQGGFVRIFVDEGKPMARLLYEAASRRTRPEYVGRLLAAFPASHQPSAVSHQLSAVSTQHSGLSTQHTLVEPLSERELEVLRLIAEGMSNEEIAQRLVVSLPTIKFHSSNIYGKLSVRNRTEAVAKARGLGLLPLA